MAAINESKGTTVRTAMLGFAALSPTYDLIDLLRPWRSADAAGPAKVPSS